MKFLLESDGKLKYTTSHGLDSLEYILIDENVMIYDYTLDNLNSIHLVYLQKNGELNYVIFKEQIKSTSKIAKFDILSNNYYQISVLIVKGKLNIFYSYSNKINSNIYALHHVIIDNKAQEKYNILRFVSRKSNRSFVVDSDSTGNIHLFYNTVSDNFSYIFYTYFNPYKNQWLQNPMMMSKPEKICEYPSILIDSKDSIHGTWWEKISSGYTLRYKRMNLSGKDMYKWIEISIPNVIQKIPYSNLYEEKNKLYIKCDEIILASNNSGYNWVFEDVNSLEIEAVENKGHEDLTVEDKVIEDIVEDKEEEVDINNIRLEQILENVEIIKYSISQIMDNQLLLSTKLDALEEQLKNPPKIGLKKFFTS